MGEPQRRVEVVKAAVARQVPTADECTQFRDHPGVQAGADGVWPEGEATAKRTSDKVRARAGPRAGVVTEIGTSPAGPSAWATGLGLEVVYTWSGARESD